MKRLVLAIFYSAIFIFLFNLCMSKHFAKGKVEIISVSDSTLNDSSLFVGYVYELFDPPSYPVQFAQISIDNLNLMTKSDTRGYYYIKTTSGTYTIKCQRDFNDWPQLIEQVENIKIDKNEIIHINFYLGQVVE